VRVRFSVIEFLDIYEHCVETPEKSRQATGSTWNLQDTQSVTCNAFEGAVQIGTLIGSLVLSAIRLPTAP
jgi:hypothetical protein